MQFSNSKILSAVLNKWLQPVVLQLSQAKMSSFPLVNAIENKIKSLGFVSGNWSLVGELSPMIEPITNSIIQPILDKYISKIPDDAIPAMAHGFIDKAIEKGELKLMEGRLVFSKDDLMELKTLLDYNLPIGNNEEYVVKTSSDYKTE